MLTLNINKLRSEVEARENRKFKTFDKVLELCNQRILYSNEKTNDLCCVFQCPNVVFGLPLYNINECIQYIMEKLVEKGFVVSFTYPNNIYISWKPYNEQKQLEYYNNNEIQQSIPKYRMLENKKQDKPKMQKANKQYRPIDDYKQSSNSIYNNYDINLFKNKLDDLFD